MNWRIVYTKQAQKDARKLAQDILREKAESLIQILREDPYRTPPSFEKLKDELKGAYSRRVNLKHPLVYELVAETRTVKILRMWLITETESRGGGVGVCSCNLPSISMILP